MKRIFLFLATNLAIMVVIGVVASITGANKFIGANGMDLGRLLMYSLIVGFTGSFISLWMSKTIAKWSTGAQVISSPSTSTEMWLVDTVGKLAAKANIPMPEVAIYEGEPNAFATGASKRSSLVAVSTGLLETMNRQEAEAVLAHEVAHIANGDMVTLTLIQGVVNTFVVFLSRIVGYAVDNFLRRNSDENSGPGMGYYISSIVCEIVFGILASMIVMYFSRKREFRADAGAAYLLGSPAPMISALQRLGGLEAGELPNNVATAGISGRPGWMELFSSHPPLEARIAALRSANR